MRVVPPLMVAQYAAIALMGQGTFPFHAIQGIGLFLGVLGVEGALVLKTPEWWHRRTWLAVSSVALACVPGTLHRLNLLRLEIHRSAQPYFLDTGEKAVLERLAAVQDDSGVLAPIKAALSVPGHTGHPVWVGEISWTPDFRERVDRAERFFDMQMPVGAMRRLVRETGAGWVYVDCGHSDPERIRSALGPMVVGHERFGCAELMRVQGDRAGTAS